MNHRRLSPALAATLACALLAGVACADEAFTRKAQAARASKPAVAPEAAEAAIRKALASKAPDVKIQKITPTPYAGLYEVFFDDQIIYVDETGSFLFQGRIIDMKSDTDVTSQRRNELARIDFGSLPLDLAFKRVKGNGKRRVALFSDPDCPYCKALERELANVTDVTIYTYLYPIDSLHPQAREKARAIWCAEDPTRAWNDLMLNGVVPTAPASCDAPIDKIVTLGEKHRVSGTPTMFFTNGRKVPGAIPKDQLEKMLDAAN